jgi:hypothetical protein
MTDTSVMNGYTDAIRNLPQKSFLGSLLFFSISNADVELDAARQQLSSLGLSTNLLRKNLRPIDAFRKAARDCGHKFKTSDEVRSELLVRSVGEDAEQAHVRLILERAEWKSGKKRRLLYEKVAELTFNRGSKDKNGYIGHSVEALRTTDHLTLTADEDGWLSLALASFTAHYNHYLTHLDSHAVRTFVREYIHSLSGVCVKESGGLYFVKQEHAEEVAKLASWVKGVGSEFQCIPLLNLADQREMILEAFEDEALKETERLMAEVGDILRDPNRVIEEKTFDGYAMKAAELRKKMSEYDEVLGARSERAALEISTYTKQIMQLVTRVKTTTKPHAAAPRRASWKTTGNPSQPTSSGASAMAQSA